MWRMLVGVFYRIVWDVDVVQDFHCIRQLLLDIMFGSHNGVQKILARLTKGVIRNRRWKGNTPVFVFIVG